MKKTVFNKTLILIKQQSGYGHSESTVTMSKSVRADVREPTVGFIIKAEAAGRRVELVATVRHSDYLSDKYTHAEYRGIRYRINAAGSTHKNMFIRLSLERG